MYSRTSVVLVLKNPPANAWDIRDLELTPGSGRCPGEENGNPLQYSCLKNPVDQGAWWTTVHGVTESQTVLKWLGTMYWPAVALMMTYKKSKASNNKGYLLHTHPQLSCNSAGLGFRVRLDPGLLHVSLILLDWVATETRSLPGKCCFRGQL